VDDVLRGDDLAWSARVVRSGGVVAGVANVDAVENDHVLFHVTAVGEDLAQLPVVLLAVREERALVGVARRRDPHEQPLRRRQKLRLGAANGQHRAQQRGRLHRAEEEIASLHGVAPVEDQSTAPSVPMTVKVPCASMARYAPMWPSVCVWNT